MQGIALLLVFASVLIVGYSAPTIQGYDEKQLLAEIAELEFKNKLASIEEETLKKLVKAAHASPSRAGIEFIESWALRGSHSGKSGTGAIGENQESVEADEQAVLSVLLPILASVAPKVIGYLINRG